MAQFGGKNTPWNRPGTQSMNPQIFGGQLGGVNAFTVSQAAALQQLGAGLTVGALGGSVIPAVNAAAFTTPQQAAFANAMNNFQTMNRSAAAQNVAAAALVAQQQQQQQQQQQKNQRTFIGTVTKLQEQYGFVDDDVFFKTDVVRGTMPRISDKVMVEAAFNPTMPFKWNAFRVQLLPSQDNQSQMIIGQQHPVYMDSQPSAQQSMRGGRSNEDHWSRNDDRRSGGGPPPRRERTPPLARRQSPQRRGNSPYGGGNVRRNSPPPPLFPNRRPSPPPNRHYGGGSSAVQATTNGLRKREHSPPASVTRRESPARSSTGVSRSSRSPARRKMRTALSRYAPSLPKNVLELREASVFDIRKRYATLYIPSDFFHVKIDWPLSVPVRKGFPLFNETTFHILHKDVDDFDPKSTAVIDPPDADYRYSAKVMLLSLPSLPEIYKKVIGLQDDGKIKEDFEFTNFGRLIQFLVGVRGKNEVMSIGGPWSPSLDGEDPENDPAVLIRTAIRTAKALCGVDLSKCSQWMKFVQVRYRRLDKEQPAANGGDSREETKHRHVETVTVFVPDVWSLVPCKSTFETFQNLLNSQLAAKLAALEPIEATPVENAAIPVTSPTAAPPSNNESAAVEGKQTAEAAIDDASKPSHWSKLDIKSMKVTELKQELEARDLESKGIRSQLVSKLTKAVKEEQETENDANANKTEEKIQDLNDIEMTVVDSIELSGDKEDSIKDAEDEQKAKEAEKKAEEDREAELLRDKKEKERKERIKELERHYNFSSIIKPGVFVFPSKTYKNGKFECKLMSLNSLLAYRQEDNKEHSFEVSIFAEAFHEMIQRDSSFALYKALICNNLKDEEQQKREKVKKTEAEKEKAEKEAEKNVEVEMVATEVSTENVNLNEEAAKEEPKKESTKPKNSEKEEKKVEIAPSLPVPDFCLAMSIFDSTRCGYLQEKDIEEILNSFGGHLSRSQIQKLLKSLPSREGFYYRKIVDVQPDQSFDIGNAELLSDNGGNRGKTTRGDKSMVTFDGKIVDIGQILIQVEKLESDRKNLEITADTLNKDMKNYKDQRDSLDRKKRRLEDDVRDYKKRLYEAEKCLKNSQDDSLLMKTSLYRCKELSDLMAKTVDKTMPKRETPDKTSKSANATKNETQKDDKPENSDKKTETTSEPKVETKSDVMENDVTANETKKSEESVVTTQG